MVIDCKKCSCCGEIKQTEEFHKNKSSPDGLYSICRECKNVKGKARRLSATVEQRQKESQRLRKSYYPLSKGGTNWPSNLQLLCPTCNRSKGSKLMSEWLPRELR